MSVKVTPQHRSRDETPATTTGRQLALRPSPGLSSQLNTQRPVPFRHIGTSHNPPNKTPQTLHTVSRGSVLSPHRLHIEQPKARQSHTVSSDVCPFRSGTRHSPLVFPAQTFVRPLTFNSLVSMSNTVTSDEKSTQSYTSFVFQGNSITRAFCRHSSPRGCAGPACSTPSPQCPGVPSAQAPARGGQGHSLHH